MLGELNRLATTYVYGFLVYPAVAPRLDFVAKQQVTPDAIWSWDVGICVWGVWSRISKGKQAVAVEQFHGWRSWDRNFLCGNRATESSPRDTTVERNTAPYWIQHDLQQHKRCWANPHYRRQLEFKVDNGIEIARELSHTRTHSRQASCIYVPGHEEKHPALKQKNFNLI